MIDMIRNYYVGGRVFVIGTYGVGKTTFSKMYSEMYNLPLVVLDNKWNYTKVLKVGGKEYARQFLANNYSELFVGDNVPYSTDAVHLETPIFNETISFIKKKKVKVVCVVCSNHMIWHDRILDSGKIFPILASSESSRALVKETIIKMNRMMKMSLKHFSDFYYKYLKQFMIDGVDIDIFDSFTNTIITKEEMYKRIDWARPDLIYSMVMRLEEFENYYL